MMALRPRDPPASAVPNDQLSSYSCISYDPSIPPAIHYDPSLAAGIVFCIAFGLSALVHTVQFVIKRKWWYSAFVLGAIGELIGWAARAHMHYCPYNKTMFTLQIAILIISPCFFTAGIYYILGELIRKWGRHYSLISPRLYLIIFIGFDLISIIVQGVGGGIASGTKPTEGAHIMLAGIIVQLVAMFSFVFLGTITLWKARSLSWDPKVNVLVVATVFSTACILARNLYRAVELGQGWNGFLISHEIYFCVLDGMLMVLAVGVFNFIHPAWFLSTNDTTQGAEDVKLEPYGS